jgi:small subunit ribosomal protein S20
MPHIPVHPSAEKRHRQSLKRQQRNRAVKTRVRTASKNALEAIAGSDKQAAATALQTAMKVLYKAASKNTVARKVARLSRRYHRTHEAAKSDASAQS